MPDVAYVERLAARADEALASVEGVWRRGTPVDVRDRAGVFHTARRRRGARPVAGSHGPLRAPHRVARGRKRHPRTRGAAGSKRPLRRAGDRERGRRRVPARHRGEDVAIPPALARRLKLRRGAEVEIKTANDVTSPVPSHARRSGPRAARAHARAGSVSEHSIGDEVLLGMSFLRHFELSQRGRALTLRAPANR